MRRGCGLALFNLEKREQELIAVFDSKGRVQGGWSRSLLRGVPQKDKKQQAQVAAREVKKKKNQRKKRKKVHRERGLAQRGCGISVIGDIQNGTGRGPEQPFPSLKGTSGSLWPERLLCTAPVCLWWGALGGTGLWGQQETFSWGGRNIQPWAVVAHPCYLCHAFSLVGCLCQEGVGELLSPAHFV